MYLLLLRLSGEFLVAFLVLRFDVTELRKQFVKTYQIMVVIEIIDFKYFSGFSSRVRSSLELYDIRS